MNETDSTPSERAPRSIHPRERPDAPGPRGVRGWAERIAREPNAIWMREMRQAARLTRTPWILFALTCAIALLMCTIGGLTAAAGTSPAEIGGALFQVFFSIAYFVVVVVGPAVAANGIASEREGRTWEAVLLTGLSPTVIARGKFLAAYTTIALYVVVLAPVGALPFLFGGVTATEVVVAFVFLFLVAALAVAFGLAVSSLMASLRGAIVVTLMLAIVVGPLLYLVFGFAGSLAINRQWASVPAAFPVWLPLAYERAPFGAAYVVLLLALPLLLCAVPAWFMYEATIANLTSEGDDRSTGLKRWFLACTPLLAAAASVPAILARDDESRAWWTMAGMAALGLHGIFAALLFASEPAGPSRRVRVHWQRQKASAWRRLLGPGLVKASMVVTVLGALAIGAVAAAGMVTLHALGSAPRKSTYIAEVFLFGSYAIPFFVFVVGLVTWLRARAPSSSPWTARVVAAGIVFLVAAGPWVIAAIAGVLAHGGPKDWLAIASPSPFYVFAMIGAVEDGTSEGGLVVPAGLVCGVAWGVTGLVLLGAAARRGAKVIADLDASFARAEAALRAEEAALAGLAPDVDPRGRG